MSSPTSTPKARAPSPGVVQAVLELWRAGQVTHDIPIHGRSMFPALRDGDLVRVVHEADDLRPGVIVVFHRSGELVAHRLLYSRQMADGNQTYLTKGDRCAEADPPVHASEILGRVVGVRRGAHYRAFGWRQRCLGWMIVQGQGVKSFLRRRIAAVFRTPVHDP